VPFSIGIRRESAMKRAVSSLVRLVNHDQIARQLERNDPEYNNPNDKWRLGYYVYQSEALRVR
jgi:hypothetical protein